MSNKGIIIKNPDVISFYQQHPNINIETINLFFIDIIKKLSTNLEEKYYSRSRDIVHVIFCAHFASQNKPRK